MGAVSQELAQIIYESQLDGLRFLEAYDMGKTGGHPGNGSDGVTFLNVDDALTLYATFSNAIPRDVKLLASALARGENAYTYASPTIEEAGLLIAEGIIRNHPFPDGNKRLALLVLSAFLSINGKPVPEDPIATSRVLVAMVTREIGIEDAARYISLCKKHYMEGRPADSGD